MIPERPAAERFAELADRYVRLVEHRVGLSLHAFVTEAHPLLVDLYRTALTLPAVEPSEDDIPDRLSTDEWQSLFQSLGRFFGEHDGYREVFDPYEGTEESVHGSLADDFADTYRDLRHGLTAWNAGRQTDAIWKWRFDFESHWGRHVTDALRPLHALMFDNRLFAQD